MSTPRASCTRGSGARAGFTLIELIVVTMIIALIGGVAVISWSAMLPNQQFNSAVRNLSEVLYGARSDAISRNREFRVYYDIDANTYKVRTPFRPGGGFAQTDEEEHLWIHETDLSESGIDILQVTIDDVRYDDGVVMVRFSPLGASSYHTIQLRQDRFDREFTVELLPVTGEIRFHDGLFEREPAKESDFQ